jgi:hypothetical protein
VELLLANYHLDGMGGSESYLVTVAEHLQRLGHGVTVYGVEAGALVDRIRDRGLRVAAAESELPNRIDAILAQDGIASLQLAERYETAPQLWVAHSEVHDFQLPVQLPDIVQRVVVMNERTADRVRSMATGHEVIRLRQPIDTERFTPRGPAPRRAEKVLLLGNYLEGERRDMLLAACEANGLRVEQFGAHVGSSAAPEVAIADADVVIGRGRVILEAMASGKAAYVYDYSGADGWVTPERYPAMESDGFDGRAFPDVPEADRVRRDLGEYRPGMGQANRDLAAMHHDARHHAQALSRIFAELAPRAGRDGDQLREMSRLVRSQWQTEGRAMNLARENATLRTERDRLQAERDGMERELRDAHTAFEAEVERVRGDVEQRLDAFKSTRKYRFAEKLGDLASLGRRARRP